MALVQKSMVGTGKLGARRWRVLAKRSFPAVLDFGSLPPLAQKPVSAVTQLLSPGMRGLT